MPYQIEILNNDESVEILTLDDETVEVNVYMNTPPLEVIVEGPAGPQNLYAGPTPPSNPTIGLVWADTSS